MLDPAEFLGRLQQNGLRHVCAVPCSFARSLIDTAIVADGIEYVPCASEAIACSVAAGLKMAGSEPLVIAQSSGPTNMGSCLTSLCKPYGIHLAMLVSWRTWKQGDPEVQHAHLAGSLPDLIRAYGYDWELLDDTSLDTAINQVLDTTRRHKILVLRENTFAGASTTPQPPNLTRYPVRTAYLVALNNRYRSGSVIFAGTTGHTSREMHAVMPDVKRFYMAGNMGGILAVALGGYLQGREMVVCGGDAEFVMHLGGITTAGRYHNERGRLTYIVFDNESHKSTGGQPAGLQHTDFVGMARAAGWDTWPGIVTSETEFAAALDAADRRGVPYFIHVKCAYDDTVRRPSADDVVNSVRAFK